MLAIPLRQVDFGMQVVVPRPQRLGYCEIAPDLMPYRSRRQAQGIRAIEIAVNRLLRGRRRLAVSDPRTCVTQDTQKCGQMLIGVPPRRNGAVEISFPQLG